jgi:hypothetical protein
MKQIIFALIMILMFASLASARVSVPSLTNIKTTDSSCDGNVEHYDVGDAVYLLGRGDAGTYNWSITGKSGDSSCKPNIVVASGNLTIPAGNSTFCIPAYTIASDDCGEYKVDADKKNTNFRVNEQEDNEDDGDNEVPEFGVVAASVALIGALAGIVLFRRH